MAPKPGKPIKPKKAWKGEKRSGPAPARHIPWPEIFKHHISVVEGHTKMLEMVQKHTVQGSGNYATISDLVKRGFEMLRQAREISRTFIPPASQRETVPLGSSSESMYPGYSPAHIEYGKAAAEVGQRAGEMKARGEKWELPENGPEYQLGQGHGAKRRSLLKKDSAESDGSKGRSEEGPQEPQEGGGQATEKEAGENQYFVIDTNPMPVALPSRSSKKRMAEDDDEEGGDQKTKENKKKKAKETEDLIETEDISAEVEARLRAKEEKAKAKEEKKRKRESMGDESEKVLKKPKKEKSKKRLTENDNGGAGDGEGEGEGKKEKSKKRKKKDVD